jgi:dTDP-glucose 4,6-dehydratase
MERWLITGGAGFIGANLVRHVLGTTDVEVVVLDKLTYAGHRESLAGLEADPRFSFLEGDIASRKTVEAIFQRHRPTAVLNLAAESHVDRSIDNARPFIDTNIVGTYELLEAARKRHGELGAEFRFLHVSTDEVYGSLGPDGRFTEETPYRPNSPYSASKAAADHLVRAYGKTYGLPVLITNCSNNYGPYQLPEKLVPLMILNALEGRKLPIYGDGGNVRDWLYVEDHCEGLVRVLRAGTPGEKYNFGGDAERTNLEVVDALLSVLQRLRPRAGGYADLKTFVEDRPGHDRRYAVDAGKVARALGWEPSRDFALGLEETVRWYLGNESWCRAVQADQSLRHRAGKP